MGSSKKTCFVICPIGKENSEIRKNADLLIKYIISPTVEKLGYETPLRSDFIPNPGTITSQIIENLIDSDLVIADLSTGNPNVFYELAVRHVTQKPCIHIIKSDDEIPFDTSPNRTIKYNLDLDGVENAKRILEEQIKSFIPGKNEADNPIGIALTMKDLKASGDSMQIILADLTEEVRELKGEMRSFQSIYNENMRFVRSRSDENEYYLTLLKPYIFNTSFLYRDPERSSKQDILDGRSELKYWEEMLKRPDIPKKEIDHIHTRINSIKRWLGAAGEIEFKDYIISSFSR